LTDFDLPAYFNTALNTFTVVTTSSSLLSQYPYKGWHDNFTYNVGSIIIENSGKGYTVVPQIAIIPAHGDSGTGATAVAYIANGSLSYIQLTNPRTGYTKTPSVLIIGGGSTLLTTATAYTRLVNNKVRSNFVNIKFDRITTDREIGSTTATTIIPTNGIDHKFDLEWAASPVKTDTQVTLDGIRVLKANYTITNYLSRFDNSGTEYSKQRSQIVLNFTPTTSSVLTVSYKKNIELYSAAERIQDYYNPNAGMPGNNLAQLMYGAEYPGTEVSALEFSADQGFGDLGFGSSNWDDAPPDVFYSQVTTSTLSQGFTTPIVSSVTILNVYVESWGPLSTLTNTTTNILLNSTRIDGTQLLVPQTIIGVGNPVTVIVNSAAFSTTSSFNKVVFRTPNQNASILSTDIDTVIDGGNLEYTTAVGYKPSDIIIDGDGFVTPFTSYAPEEMVPGQINESFGIDVFTVTPQTSPNIINQSQLISDISTSTTIKLNLIPPSEDSVIVSYNDLYLTHNIDYTLNLINNTITINTQTTVGVVSITVVGVGGINLLSSVTLTTSTNKITINSRNLYSNVGSMYITVNGVTASRNATTGLRYVFTATNSNIGVANISGMTTGTNNIQAWFFNPAYKAFNELKQQLIPITAITSTFDLIQTPGIAGPFEEQVIVEVNGLRVDPPETTYYQVENNQTSFVIHPYGSSILGIYSLDQIKVFQNGRQLNNIRDFILEQNINTIMFNPGFLSNGDVLAIETYHQSQYTIDEIAGTLTLTKPAQPGDLVNIITFTSADALATRLDARAAVDV
jgi:hypothetical protein